MQTSMARTFVLLLLTFFFRQMTETGACGQDLHRATALYQIKRKKREEYVDDDARLNKS